jgi:hypothetical protein
MNFILFGLAFEPENGDTMFETSVCTSTGPHGVTYERTVPIIGSVCNLPLAGFFLGLLLNPEDVGSTFLRNISGHLPDYTALHMRQQYS